MTDKIEVPVQPSKDAMDAMCSRWKAAHVGVRCPLCNSAMDEAKKHVGTSLGAGVLLLVLGGILTVTGILAIIGIPCMIVALFMGGRNVPIWRCGNCGYVAERQIVRHAWLLWVVLGVAILITLFACFMRLSIG